MGLARSVLVLVGAAWVAVSQLGCSGEAEETSTARATLTTPAALAWSRSPPGGLQPWQVPQFVALTFDDNYTSGLNDVKGGMTWATTFMKPLVNPTSTMQASTFDGVPLRTTFFFTSLYIDGDMLNQKAWRTAFADKHEAADHTRNHSMGGTFTLAQWIDEIQACKDALIHPMNGIGAMASDVIGFRAPYLAYNASMYTALVGQSFFYDSSVQNCSDDGEDGTNCSWPYTLDQGSPDAAALTRKFVGAPIDKYPGLWEAPLAAFFVPPDSKAADYQFMPGLRGRIAALGLGPSTYDPATGRIGGADITLFLNAKMAASEVTATLEYTLDLHLAGNRAPMVILAHSHVYASNYTAPVGAPDYVERQQAIEKFIAYALAKRDVRARPVRDILAWMQQPVALGDAVRPEGGPDADDATSVEAGDGPGQVLPEASSEGGSGGGGAPGVIPPNAGAGTAGKKSPSTGGSGMGCTCRVTDGARGTPFASLVLLLPIALGARRIRARTRAPTAIRSKPRSTSRSSIRPPRRP
jgi:peptidoglycan/xylan/chitin deacetylase (PgdA/CDA1 family)